MINQTFTKKIINFTPEEEEIVEKQSKEFRFHLRGFGPTVRFIIRDWAEMKRDQNKESQAEKA